jgi:hypothetical protein
MFDRQSDNWKLFYERTIMIVLKKLKINKMVLFNVKEKTCHYLTLYFENEGEG